MFIKSYRILRNQEGASPGGGAVPPAPADPATNGSGQPAFSLDDIKAAVAQTVATTVAEKFAEQSNGLFANLRKAGVLKQDKPEEPKQPQPTAPSAALSMADVEAMLERERVITARATKHDLNDAQIRRMKAALSGVSADRFADEADAFLSDLGLAKTTTPPATVNTQQAPAATPAPPTPPISDKGPPSPGQYTPNWKLELGQNPIGMSPAARTAMDAELGVEKARKMRLEASRQQAERIRVTGKG